MYNEVPSQKYFILNYVLHFTGRLLPLRVIFLTMTSYYSGEFLQVCRSKL